jgi:serine phosphatase RsbU (regulator of sigma subunit)
LYTDGITEYRDELGAEYGERRLRQVLEREALLAPDRIVAAVRADLAAFAGDAAQDDDFTLVVVRTIGS